MRAELLVLRRWPAALGLLAITPLLVLLSDYVGQWIFYLTLTPALYSTEGNGALNLAGLLPSQFNIIAVNQFELAGTAPFIVLGAAMAGGDWGRGTITTALLQGPGRARTFAGQVGALMVAVGTSVLATFAVAAAASSVIGLVEVKSVSPAAEAMPGISVIAQSAGAAFLVAIAYGVVGLFLGTVFRSAAGAVAVALVWTLIVEGTLWDLALALPRTAVRTISDLTLNASAITMTGLYGDPGGGPSSQNYLQVRTTVAIATLLAYTVLAVALSLLVLRRRDAVSATSRRLKLRPRQRGLRRHRLPRWLRPAGWSGRNGQPRPESAVTGVLASLRAELLVMRKRPAVWALVLVLPAVMLLNSYGYAYVLYATANSGVTLGINAQQVMSTLLPDQYLMAALNGGFGQFNQVYGVAIFMLLGALVGGSDWGRNTIRTALLQGPDRWRTVAGQVLALATAVAASVVLTFVLAAAGSEVIALHQTGSLAPAGGQFPAFGHVAAAVAAGLVLGLAYAAIGLTLGVWLRSAGAAIGAVLLWAVVLEPSIEYFGGQLHGFIVRVYQALPDASTNALVNLDGTPGYYYGAGQPVGHVATVLAFVILGLYAVVFLTVPALITKRRDLT